MLTNLVILADNLWNDTMSRYFRLPHLQLPQSGNSNVYNYHLTSHAAAHRHMKTERDFHCANEKIPENFGRKSNGTFHFGFFLPQYSRSPLEVVHLFRSDRKTGSLLYFTDVGNSEKE